MPDHNNEIYALIKSTALCLSGIADTAKKLEGHSIVALIELAIERSDPDALKITFWLAAFNQLEIPPSTFCSGLLLIEELTNICPLLRYQTEKLLPSLLAMANDSGLTDYQRVWVSCMATTIIVDKHLESSAIIKVLQKLKLLAVSNQLNVYLDAALNFIEKPLQENFMMYLFSTSLSDILPKTAPAQTTGGSYTVRRSVEKLGRNEPCHCASGKKYKKCCMPKDQELLRDASAYQGITQTELKNNPGLVDDPEIINKMPAHQLKSLKADQLGDKQIFFAYRQASYFRLWQVAFEMLLACKERLDPLEFDAGHFDDLLYEVLSAGEVQLAHQIEVHCEQDENLQETTNQVRFDLLENPQHYQKLEDICLKVVAEQSDDYLPCGLAELAHNFEDRFPSLALVFARAAIVSSPQNYFENQCLLEVIHGIRIDLDLDPWQDPAELVSKWQQEYEKVHRIEATNSAAMKKLTSDLKATRLLLKSKQNILQAMEKELVNQKQQLVEKQEQKQSSKIAKSTQQDEQKQQADAGATISRLRNKLESLKGEICAQQAQRNQLKDSLKQERHKSQVMLKEHENNQQQEISANQELEFKPSGKLLIPSYSEDFNKASTLLPISVTGRAMIMVGQFAGHDPEIWRQTKKVIRLKDHYRIRINRDYRLLLFWQAGEQLKILDIIPRQELESWIKRHS